MREPYEGKNLITNSCSHSSNKNALAQRQTARPNAGHKLREPNDNFHLNVSTSSIVSKKVRDLKTGKPSRDSSVFERKNNCASPAAGGSPSSSPNQKDGQAKKGQQQPQTPCKLLWRRWGANCRVTFRLGVRLSPDLALSFNPGAAVRAPIWIAPGDPS